jgi:hypothetical protein
MNFQHAPQTSKILAKNAWSVLLEPQTWEIQAKNAWSVLLDLQTCENLHKNGVFAYEPVKKSKECRVISAAAKFLQVFRAFGAARNKEGIEARNKENLARADRNRTSKSPAALLRASQPQPIAPK